MVTWRSSRKPSATLDTCVSKHSARILLKTFLGTSIDCGPLVIAVAHVVCCGTDIPNLVPKHLVLQEHLVSSTHTFVNHISMVELPAGTGMLETMSLGRWWELISPSPTTNTGWIKLAIQESAAGGTLSIWSREINSFRNGVGLSSRKIGMCEELAADRNSTGLSWSAWPRRHRRLGNDAGFPDWTRSH